MPLDYLYASPSNHLASYSDVPTIASGSEIFATMEIVCQIFIVIGGISSLYLIERENRWGYMIGLVQQPFWFYTTAFNGQWGLFALCFAYAYIWARGVRKRFGRKV